MPKDANGTELNAGDNVTLIKDLKVKGAGATLKRGTLVKKHKNYGQRQRDRGQDR